MNRDTTVLCFSAAAAALSLAPVLAVGLRVATRVSVVGPDGEPVVGAAVVALSGPFPRVAPLVGTRLRRFRTNAQGAAVAEVRPGFFTSIWASWRDKGRLFASRSVEGVVAGRPLRLELRPFGADRFVFRGLGPWRRLFGGRLGAGFVGHGLLAFRFDVEVPASGVVAMPPLPFGSFVVAVTGRSRPVDWAEMGRYRRRFRAAAPVAAAVAGYAVPGEGPGRVFLDYGAALGRLVSELGNEDRDGIWLSRRREVYRHDLQLVALDPDEERGPCRIRAPRPGAGIVLREAAARKQRAWAGVLVGREGRPLAQETLWTSVGQGLAATTTDAEGRFRAFGRMPRIYRIEGGRGLPLYPSRCRSGPGSAVTIDLRRRLPVAIRTLSLDGRPLPWAVCHLDSMVVGPTDRTGRSVVRLMPGRYVAHGGLGCGPDGHPFLLRNPVDPDERFKLRTTEPTWPRSIDVEIWRMVEVAGRVVDRGGRPVPDARVELRRAGPRAGSAGSETIWYGTTDAAGSFGCRIPDFPGAHSLVARARVRGRRLEVRVPFRPRGGSLVIVLADRRVEVGPAAARAKGAGHR